MAEYGTEVIGRFDFEFGNRTADRSLLAADGPGCFLPPYALELNPDELVWAHVKARVAKATTQTPTTCAASLAGRLRAIAPSGGVAASTSRAVTCALHRARA